MAVTNSNPFSLNITEAVPAWFTSLASLTFATPLSNWLGAAGVIDPLATSTNQGSSGHSSVVTTWNGMGVDQARKTLFLLRNGGHNDYYGNEVYAANLAAGSPAWSRVKNATANSGGTPPAGNPVSAHTYYELNGHNGRWFSTHTGSGSPSGFTDSNRCWEYVADTASWIDRGVIGNQGAVGGGGSYYNEATNQLILIGNGSPFLKIYNCAGGAFTLSYSGLTKPNNFDIYTLCSIDTTNNILLAQYQYGGNNVMHSVDLNNPAGGFTTFTPTGATRHLSQSNLVWHPASNAFLGWAGGSTMVKLSLTRDGTNRYTAGVFTTVTLSGTAPTDQSVNGMYSKVNLIRDMGNGQALFVLLPRYGNPDLYVAKITGAV